MNPLTSLAPLVIFLVTVPGLTTVDLQPHTVAAFDDYVRNAEARIDNQVHGAAFLWSDADPNRRRRVHNGEAVAEPLAAAADIEIPDGMIHDWVGAVFIPGVTLEKVIGEAQNYDAHAGHYGPELQESKIIHRDGSEFDIYMRLLKKEVITVVLNTNHHAQYYALDAARAYSASHSTRIAEVENPGRPGEFELPPGHDHGFLWRLNTYWRFQQRDGGVYVECEALSLTRAIPDVFAWIVNPIVRTLPRESLVNTLRSLRTSAQAR